MINSKCCWWSFFWRNCSHVVSCVLPISLSEEDLLVILSRCDEMHSLCSTRLSCVMLCLVFNFTRNWSAHGILSVRVCSFSTFVHFGFRTRTPVHPYVQLGGLFCDECLLLHSILFLELLYILQNLLFQINATLHLTPRQLLSSAVPASSKSPLFFQIKIPIVLLLSRTIEAFLSLQWQIKLFPTLRPSITAMTMRHSS